MSKIGDHIQQCCQSVGNALTLRALLERAKTASESEEPIQFVYHTHNLPLETDEAVQCLRHLMSKAVIEVPDFQETLDFGSYPVFAPDKDGEEVLLFDYYAFTVKIPSDAKKKYAQWLKSTAKKINSIRGGMNLEKQVGFVKKAIRRRQKAIGNREVYISFQDLPKKELEYINLYFVLLYLEEEGCFKIQKIEAVDTYDLTGDLKFLVQDKARIIQGDTYIIDLDQCSIKFKNLDRPIYFSRSSEVYRLLNLFYENGPENPLHCSKIAEEISRDGHIPDDESAQKEYLKGLTLRIRKNCLKTTFKKSQDILLNKRGYLSLKGVKKVRIKD